LTESPCHNQFEGTIHPRHNQIVTAARLGQRPNDVHAPIRKWLYWHTGERINTQLQARGTFSCRARTAATDKMSHISEQIWPSKELGDIGRCTCDVRVSNESPTVRRVKDGIPRHPGHTNARHYIPVTMIAKEPLCISKKITPCSLIDAFDVVIHLL
jgi:hypothetical protein